MKNVLEPIRKALREPEEIKYHVVRPFEDLLDSSLGSTVLLIVASLAAMALANSSHAPAYFHLREIDLSISMGPLAISKDLKHWVDEGLMSLFFFVVGLEIKREVIVGELKTRSKAMLPVWAALGGMVVPGAIYVLFNYGQPTAGGWGIPMATDIAFALGVLYVLGDKVPLGLKIFLSALAIVDDLGAAFVIALFYTQDIVMDNLLISVVIVLMIAVLNFFWVRKTLPYAVLGILLWLFILGSGVHATVAGILVAAFIPVRGKSNTDEFIQTVGHYLGEFRCPLDGCGYSVLLDEKHMHSVTEIGRACHDVETPLQRLEQAMHPWVSFVVLPVFAFMNAGVAFDVADIAAVFAMPLTLGVFFGLSVGKPIGIVVFSLVAVRMGFATLPAGVRWRHIAGAGLLGGIGFTMSLFISGLSFGDAALEEQAKLGIILGSMFSGVLGLTYLWLVLRGKEGGS